MAIKSDHHGEESEVDFSDHCLGKRCIFQFSDWVGGVGGIRFRERKPHRQILFGGSFRGTCTTSGLQLSCVYSGEGCQYTSGLFLPNDSPIVSLVVSISG